MEQKKRSLEGVPEWDEGPCQKLGSGLLYWKAQLGGSVWMEAVGGAKSLEQGETLSNWGESSLECHAGSEEPSGLCWAGDRPRGCSGQGVLLVTGLARPGQGRLAGAGQGLEVGAGQGLCAVAVAL